MKSTLLLAVLAAALVGAALAERPFEWGNLDFDEEAARKLSSEISLATISRGDVMSRAMSWVDKQIPYCQCNGAAECCGSCPYCKQYRCDCSGYVSFSWNLPYGYTTYTLPQVAHQINKEDLKEGDVLLNTAEHVVLFAGWADASHNTYYGLQEPGCHTAGPHYAFKSVIQYPFGNDPSFVPYRYNNIGN